MVNNTSGYAMFNIPNFLNNIGVTKSKTLNDGTKLALYIICIITGTVILSKIIKSFFKKDSNGNSQHVYIMNEIRKCLSEITNWDKSVIIILQLLITSLICFEL